MRPWGTSWYTLPNAEHINAVLLHAKAYPHKWTHLRNDLGVRYQALLESVALISGDVGVSIRKEVDKIDIPDMWKDYTYIININVTDPCQALAGWHDCAYMLDLHPDVVRTLAGSGNHAAVLLLPAIIAMRGDDDASDGTSAEGARPEAV